MPSRARRSSPPPTARASAGSSGATGCGSAPRRFVAGETLDEAVPVLRGLNEQGLKANTTLLGEHVADRAETLAVVGDTSAILERLAAERLRVNVALKLTHLGLAARPRSSRTRTSRASSPTQRGSATSSASTWRSRATSTPRWRSTGGCGRAATTTSAPSSRRTSTAARPTSSRCCRSRRTSGSSRAPTSSRRRSPTRRKPTSTRRSSGWSSARSRASGYTAVATHDERAITPPFSASASAGDRFELQMLYGVRPQLQLDLAAAGPQGARRDAVRPRVVPVPDAPARRAPGEPRLLPAQPSRLIGRTPINRLERSPAARGDRSASTSSLDD